MTLRQRLQRKRDADYLAWLRTQRCACGCGKGPPCDAAHLRASSYKYNKENPGVGQKPDDKWALPLKHAHHMAMHDHGDERGWWFKHGVSDPFALCIKYHAKFRKEVRAKYAYGD